MTRLHNSDNTTITIRYRLSMRVNGCNIEPRANREVFGHITERFARNGHE